MEVKQPKTIQAESGELSKVQGYFREFAEQFAAFPFVLGAMLKVQGSEIISVDTAGITINHGMQRVPAGWILVDNTAEAIVYRTASSDKSITLKASAPTFIKVWVY